MKESKTPSRSFKSRVFSLIKAVYHLTLLFVYKLQGLFCNIALCNSTWTLNHVRKNWGYLTPCKILYPPCNVEEFWCPNGVAKEATMVSFA